MSALPLSSLTAVTPVDGRYAEKCVALREHFSEYALIKRRVAVEIYWLLHLADEGAIPQLPPFDAETRAALEKLAKDFTVEQAERVKAIEKTTNHDVKAVEYFLKETFKSGDASLTSRLEFFHFACTSEDINNLSYALMLRDARKECVTPAIAAIEKKVVVMAHELAEVPMLSHTHGQPATPTTVGKELANVVHRLRRQAAAIEAVPILGKVGPRRAEGRSAERREERREERRGRSEARASERAKRGAPITPRRLRLTAPPPRHVPTDRRRDRLLPGAHRRLPQCRLAEAR